MHSVILSTRSEGTQALLDCSMFKQHSSRSYTLSSTLSVYSLWIWMNTSNSLDEYMSIYTWHRVSMDWMTGYLMYPTYRLGRHRINAWTIFFIAHGMWFWELYYISTCTCTDLRWWSLLREHWYRHSISGSFHSLCLLFCLWHSLCMLLLEEHWLQNECSQHFHYSVLFESHLFIVLFWHHSRWVRAE